MSNSSKLQIDLLNILGDAISICMTIFIAVFIINILMKLHRWFLSVLIKRNTIDTKNKMKQLQLKANKLTGYKNLFKDILMEKYTKHKKY
jgi:hypothetical protein